MPSFDVLADAVKEIVEGGLGMLEAAGDKVFAYDDGSVCPVIGSIAGAELNALAWQGGVDANVVLAMAGGAERWRWRWRMSVSVSDSIVRW